MNIIQKLNTTTGSKKEKYMSQVRKEFKLAKDERWVITKLRMMIVRLDANLKLLQIRKPLTSKADIMLSPRDKIKSKAQKAIPHKCKVFVKEDSIKKALSEEKKKSVQQATKQKTTTRKPKKTLEARQLEKLRNMDFIQDDQRSNTLVNKVAFLKFFSLQSQVVYI